jgi:S-adenosylmethionine hydrolase
MPRPVITLTTDFGLASSYVAQMKGVILGINPDATILDVTHDVPAQNVMAGAIALRDATRYFPEDSIHVAVVDPGVGSARRIAYAEIDKRHYLAPDNGLLSLLTRECPPARLIEVTRRELFRDTVSSTFHGRDIFAPVAARLSLGLNPGELGPPLPALTMLEWPSPVRESETITGRVTHVDGFGNAITNVHQSDLAALANGPLEVLVAGHVIAGTCTTYSYRPPGELIALVGSSGYLEVAIVNGSAAREIGLKIEDRVVVRRAGEV